MEPVIYLEKEGSIYSVYYYNGVYVGEFSMDVDGFYYYWPVCKQGCVAAHFLRALANELDRLNEPYEREVEEYFSK